MTEILNSENFQTLYSNVGMVNERQKAGECTLGYLDGTDKFITNLYRGLPVGRYLMEEYIR